MTKEIINTWIQIEQRIAAKYGPFRLFGLFLQETSSDRWHVVLSAPWLDGHGLERRAPFVEEFRQSFSGYDVVHWAGFIFFDEDSPSVQEILEEVHVEHGKVKLRNFEFEKVDVKTAYIITAQVLEPNAEAAQ